VIGGVLGQMTTPIDWPGLIVTSLVVFGGTAAAAWLGVAPLRELIARQEQLYDRVLRGKLLIDISPRSATVMSAFGVVAMALLGYVLTRGATLGAMLGVAAGIFLPTLVLRVLQKRRVERLEDQLVSGIQTLASGVRAGLNLVQAMELIARDGPVPLRQEFAHLVREYEYGMPLDDAMAGAADRIGSSDFRLLFSALHTHRERGGDLGETLDRIASSIREIQRMEKRVEALTAQGRTTARWLGAMPLVVMAIYYLIVDDQAVVSLFQDSLGNLILVGIAVLNVLGFLWIRKIVAIDI
jgi:tight adherence protein B